MRRRNPPVRVDVAFSILTSKNYELLPDMIAPKNTFQKSVDDTVLYYQDKRTLC